MNLVRCTAANVDLQNLFSVFDADREHLTVGVE
jgi:hypothetical protein